MSRFEPTVVLLGVDRLIGLQLARILWQRGVPVVGVGGIDDAEDALKFFALGCAAIQVGTAQMRDPFAAARIARDLRR